MRNSRGFSLIEVIIGLAVVLTLVVTVSMMSTSMRRTSASFASRGTCEAFTQNIKINLASSGNSLWARTYIPTRYDDQTPLVANDSRDSFCNSTGARSVLCDAAPYFALDNQQFVLALPLATTAPVSRYAVGLYQNIRNTNTWAKNIYNNCNGSGPCPLPGGNIRSGVVFTGSNLNSFLQILPTAGVNVPDGVTEVRLSVTAVPNVAVIDGAFDGIVTVNMSAIVDGKQCAMQPVQLRTTADSDAPVIPQGTVLRTYRSAYCIDGPGCGDASNPSRFCIPGTTCRDRGWRNPHRDLVSSLAYSEANPPASGNVGDFVGSAGPGRIQLAPFDIREPGRCLCTQDEFRRHNYTCPHWTRSVHLRVNVQEAGSALLCQRLQTATQTAVDEWDATPPTGPANLRRFRYCAVGLGDKDDNPKFNPPCLVPITGVNGIDTCALSVYNDESQIDLNWNDLEDGEYDFMALAVDSTGNRSKTHRFAFKVAVPNVDMNTCPPAENLCPNNTVQPTARDTSCGYTFYCNGTRPNCPRPELYCPASAPCWATNTCPAPYNSHPRSACDGLNTMCPGGSRVSTGCPARNTYGPTELRYDDCGFQCPAGTKTPQCPSPAPMVLPGASPMPDGAGGFCPNPTFPPDYGCPTPPPSGALNCSALPFKSVHGTDCPPLPTCPPPTNAPCTSTNYCYLEADGDFNCRGTPCNTCPPPEAIWGIAAAHGTQTDMNNSIGGIL